MKTDAGSIERSIVEDVMRCHLSGLISLAKGRKPLHLKDVPDPWSHPSQELATLINQYQSLLRSK